MPDALTPAQAASARRVFDLAGEPGMDAAVRAWQFRLLELGENLGRSGPRGNGVDGVVGNKTKDAFNRLAPPQYHFTDRPSPSRPPAPSAPRPEWSLNEAPFFAHIRSALFRDRKGRGQMTQSQVEGIQRLLAAWKQYGTGDARHLAYVLATAYWETGRKMQPVEEVGKGRGHAYGRAIPPYGHAYYGRGDVQLTWWDNYLKMERLLGIPLTQHPELALRPDVSARILIEGMTAGVSRDGDFTGKSLEDYTNPNDPSPRGFDPIGARRVVNGTDRAREIATIYGGFLAALSAGGLPVLTRVGA